MRRYAIIGAGSIGCYVGGVLAHAGIPVVFAGRGERASSLTRGLELTTFDGPAISVKAGEFSVASSIADAVARADIIVVATKARDTENVADAVRGAAPPSVRVLSLQNGIQPVATLRRVLAGRLVIAGMVPFNVRLTPRARCSDSDPSRIEWRYPD